MIDAKAIPIQAYLGPVGMPGVTAWYGLNKIIAPKAGETVLVSARPARSARWSANSRNIAGAGRSASPEAPRNAPTPSRSWATTACVDHKSPHFAEELKAALPNGVDGLFENVGGEPFAQALRRLNTFARVAICGLIASYEGAPTTLPDMRIFLVKRFKMEGFIVSDHMNLWPQAIDELADHRRREAADLA